MAHKFEIHKDKKGEYRVRFKYNSEVMFASEGMFMDVAGNPVNATISLGIEHEPLSASAVTILGTTGTIERWRWNGSSWTK